MVRISKSGVARKGVTAQHCTARTYRFTRSLLHLYDTT